VASHHYFILTFDCEAVGQFIAIQICRAPAKTLSDTQLLKSYIFLFTLRFYLIDEIAHRQKNFIRNFFAQSSDLIK
jgi:hypothetical protein